MDRLSRFSNDSNDYKPAGRIFLSYLVDYIVIIALFGAISALNFVTPFNQHFALQNYTLQYPYALQERVPVALLYVCAVAAPAVIIAFWTLALDPLLDSWRARRDGKPKEKYTKGFWELNCGILGLLLANTAAYVITSVLKNACGKPRPDLIDRCQPNVPMDHFVSPVYGLSNSTICTQTDMSIMRDGFRSFPSGHSSSSFAGLFYLSLYIAGKIHFLDHRGEVWKVFVVMIPTLGAGLIAITRIMDARHHPFDVIFGSLLGVLCAFVAYRQYFPSVTETDHLGRAYTVRRHMGSRGLEPLRLVQKHQPKPSFQVQPADEDIFDHEHERMAMNHGSQDWGHIAPGPASPGWPGHRREPSELAERKPLHQRKISLPTNPRDSLGISPGSAGILQREYSPDPSFKSRASNQRRPSPAGPLDSSHGSSNNHSYSQRGGGSGGAAWHMPPTPHAADPSEVAARRAELLASPPPADRPDQALEMSDVPNYSRRMAAARQADIADEEHGLQPADTAPFTVEEGGERLIHPAFRGRQS